MEVNNDGEQLTCEIPPQLANEILHSNPTPIAVVSSLGEIAYFNKSFSETFGEEDSNSYQYIQNILQQINQGVPITLNPPQEITQHTNPDGSLTFHDLEIEDVSGMQRTYSIRIVAMSRGFNGVAVYFEDMTEQRQIQNAEIRGFAHMVSHELRDSLAILIGFVEVSLERIDASSVEEMRSYLKSMRYACQRVKGIMDGILCLVDLRKEVEVVTIDSVSDIFDEVLTLVRTSFSEDQWEVILPDSFFQVQANADMLFRVFGNLITNAIKYGGSPPRIEITCTASEDGFVCFGVSDNGPGIPKELMHRLFQPFSRLPNSGQRKRKGTGLGLYLAKGYVERMEGRIWVESEVGKGTTFYFTLPKA